MQNVFERLSDLHGNEPDKADYFLTKAWESYWQRLEYGEWLNKMRKGSKKPRDYLIRPMFHWLQVYIRALSVGLI